MQPTVQQVLEVFDSPLTCCFSMEGHPAGEMAPSPDARGKLDPAKAKSEERRQQLEAFRAAKKAASLGHKTQPPATAPARPLKSR